MAKLEWSNLLTNRCPKCGEDISDSFDDDIIVCPNHDCDFTISVSRMAEVIENINKKKYD